MKSIKSIYNFIEKLGYNIEFDQFEYGVWNSIPYLVTNTGFKIALVIPYSNHDTHSYGINKLEAYNPTKKQLKQIIENLIAFNNSHGFAPNTLGYSVIRNNKQSLNFYYSFDDIIAEAGL